MSDVLKVSASVYSRKEPNEIYNSDGFYLNGKFVSEYDIDNIQASFENRGIEYVFAVSHNMEFENEDNNTSISAIRETGKYHEKITVNSGDMEFKIHEFSSKIDETNKHINSLLVGEESEEEAPEINRGFAGLLLTEKTAIAMNVGNCHVYIVREGVFKHMTTDFAKAQRLLNLGIISDEQAESLNERFGMPTQLDENEIHVSEPIELQEGDKFLICSNGLVNTLGDEKIEDFLSMRSDSNYIAYRLVSEGTKKGTEEALTAAVVRIDKISIAGQTSKKMLPRMKQKESTPTVSTHKSDRPKFKYDKRNFQKYEGAITLGIGIVTTILLGVIIWLIIKSMLGLGGKPKDNDRTSKTTTKQEMIVKTSKKTDSNQTSAQTDTMANPKATPTPEETTTQATTTKAPTTTRNSTVPSDYKTITYDGTPPNLYRIGLQEYGEQAIWKAINKYNKSIDPTFDGDKLKIGQKIVLPPRDFLKKFE